MTNSNIIKKLLGVNGYHVVIQNLEFYKDHKNIEKLIISVRPTVYHSRRCPHCNKKCPSYDQPDSIPALWRDIDWGGIVVYLAYRPHRIQCPEHGIVTESIPWAYRSSRFTTRFDNTATWIALQTSKSATSYYMRISWATVGRCISRAAWALEPDRSHRLDNLVHIGIDETSYRKGHKYITTVVNHDTNEVVWVGVGHGKAVLSRFYKSLTLKQRQSIEVTTGDGASWITECVEEYTPWSKRGVDPFHVVAWAGEVLDAIRVDSYRAVLQEVTGLSNRPLAEVRSTLQDKQQLLHALKYAKNALNKSPEKLWDSQKLKLELIASQNPLLYTAYSFKEGLRSIFKEDNIYVVEDCLDFWLEQARNTKDSRMLNLADKIERHREHILVAIHYRYNNARVEANNNIIKLIIRKAFGFRNIQNLIDLIYLKCSNIRVPLPNRGN